MDSLYTVRFFVYSVVQGNSSKLATQNLTGQAGKESRPLIKAGEIKSSENVSKREEIP